jgi:hypothetical protein
MINIAMDAGSGRAGSTISPIMQKLNENLDSQFTSEISTECEDISIVLRVSGDVHSFGFEGCEDPTYNKRERSIEVDIGIAQEQWESKSKEEITATLQKYLSSAIHSSYLLIETKGFLPDVSDIKSRIDTVFSKV